MLDKFSCIRHSTISSHCLPPAVTQCSFIHIQLDAIFAGVSHVIFDCDSVPSLVLSLAPLGADSICNQDNAGMVTASYSRENCLSASQRRDVAGSRMWRPLANNRRLSLSRRLLKPALRVWNAVIGKDWSAVRRRG